MKFSVVVEQVLDVVQRQGRVSYRMLKREFELDDDFLADLKEELLYSYAQQVREEGPGLVWTGATSVPSSPFQVSSSPFPTPNSHPPVAYTPPHLAARIRAEQAAMEARGATDGERKTITALFADLKGSTALVEGLDPEEAEGSLIRRCN
jgi:hypothetical protein